MPRQPRLNLAEGVYHVTQRGLERRDIVLNNDDRQDWLRLFDRHATRCGWRVFAYALLDNHFHIFLRTPQPNLSEGMHAFESGYVSLFNRRHKRTGPLFQSRFGAVLIEHESHAQVLSRYVHLNPHRAGLDPRPGEYRWCSLRYYLNPDGAPAWLDWQTILRELSTREGAARIAYRRFVMEGTTAAIPNPLAEVTADGLLGSETFLKRHSGQAPQNSELAEKSVAVNRERVSPILNSAEPDPGLFERLLIAVAEEFDVSVESIRQPGRHRNWARVAAIHLAHESLRMSQAEIATRFDNASESAIRDALRRAATRLQKPDDEMFQQSLRRICTKLDSHSG